MRMTDADKACKAIENYRVKKDPCGSLMNEWDRGYNYGLDRAEAEIQNFIVEAIPIEWIKKRIEDLDEYISKWGGVFEQEAVVNAKIHEVGGLVRLIADWREEREEE